MKVSIIIPIYGVEKYIERCSRSLFEQTHEDIEYLFVNDCTKDSSIEILRSVIDEYPSRNEQVKIIEHHHNRGLAAARNTGVDASTGEYLMHVDSDDWLDANAVSLLVDKAQSQRPDVILFGSKSIYVDREVVRFPEKYTKEQYIKSVIVHSTPASIWNKFYRSEFYKNSGIRSIEGVDHGEDYVVVPRLLHSAQTFIVIDEPIYNYNQTNIASYTKNISTKSIISLLSAAHELYKYFTSIDDHEIYEYQISILYVRTMLALVKMATPSSYALIYETFKPYINEGVDKLSLSDKLLYTLLKIRLYRVLYTLILIYNRRFIF